MCTHQITFMKHVQTIIQCVLPLTSDSRSNMKCVHKVILYCVWVRSYIDCYGMCSCLPQLLTNHYERCWKYYCLAGGWGNFGVASDEELHLSRKMFWGIFDALSRKVRLFSSGSHYSVVLLLNLLMTSVNL